MIIKGSICQSGGKQTDTGRIINEDEIDTKIFFD